MSESYYRNHSTIVVNGELSNLQFQRVQLLLRGKLDPYRKGTERYVLDMRESPTVVTDEVARYLRELKIPHTVQSTREWVPANQCGVD